MDSIIVRTENFKTTHWGGGSTTEFYIYPEGSNYAERNFDFRLSMATVEVEKSDFTALPGVSRKLMVLDGLMTLNHEGQHSKTLGKFDVDRFDGGWNTSSIGKCTDFNLMTRGDCNGDISGKLLEKGAKYQLLSKSQPNMICVFLYKGQLSIDSVKGVDLLNTGELSVLHPSDTSNLSLSAMVDSEIVIVEVNL